ncbi:NAD-dependent epimerase/dehydratase family protein [Paenibacillaceae bacterium WGS1546]|uniref:NAD-dependent epimerase/dehydratase family protein n=1 Tax=Cohnella sp. WGS1546 TaxID=3366810 RepID=UPI00372D1E2C
MKTIYITGCNGFIGSRLLRYFSVMPDYEVYGITRGKNFVENKMIYCDYKDEQFLKQIIKENCYVIHAAAAIPDTTNDNIQIELINTQLAKFLINIFKSKNVIKFFNLSGINVYGYGQRELVNVKEDADIVLSNFYAKAKYISEILLSANFNLNYNLRISSPYGRGKKTKTILELLIDKIINDEEIEIYGEGERKQDFIWVEDVSRIIHELIINNVAPGDYNLCSGSSLSIREIILLLEILTGHKANIVSIQKPEYYSVSVSNENILKGIKKDCSFFTPFEKAVKELL